jgi:hypothetical protein
MIKCLNHLQNTLYCNPLYKFHSFTASMEDIEEYNRVLLYVENDR